MNRIDRKDAEAARRRAIELAPLLTPGQYELDNGSAEQQAERRACAKLWNAFCTQEQARLDAKDVARGADRSIEATYSALGWK